MSQETRERCIRFGWLSVICDDGVVNSLLWLLLYKIELHAYIKDRFTSFAGLSGGLMSEKRRFF